MYKTLRVSMEACLLANMLLIVTLIPASAALAEEPDPSLVPEPWVHETHEYNVTGEINGTPTDEYFVNEKWSIEVQHGDVMTLIMARNITQDEVASVDYTNNIHYDVDGKLYIAQFMIMELVFEIGGYTIHSPLSTCSDFTLEYSPTRYDGTVPTLDCNITYEGISVYSGASLPAEYGTSTVNLTLVHHIRGELNNTRIKIEALLDFGNTRFYSVYDGSEFSAGTPFTAEIWYMMMVANPEDLRTIGPLIPTSHTNTTLEYNLTLDDGTPLTVSKLEMRDGFTIYNATGALASEGYSSMELYGGQAQVTHGFPNLTYGDTLSMRSDPEVIVYHKPVTEADDPNNGLPWMLLPVAAGIVAAAVGAALVLRARKSD